MIGFSKFFIEQSEDIPGYTWAHTRNLTLFFKNAETVPPSGPEDYLTIYRGDLCGKRGYRDGVVLFPIPLSLFQTQPLKSRVVEVNADTEFVTVCKSRVAGEKPRKKTMALVDTLPDAQFITAVLYHKDVLAEDNDRSTSNDWELVALLCQMDPDEPMNTATSTFPCPLLIPRTSRNICWNRDSTVRFTSGFQTQSDASGKPIPPCSFAP